MLSFIIATCIVTLVPGPSMMLIMLNSIQRGFISGINTSFGAVVADAILLVITLSGVGALIVASPQTYLVLKIIGALYLIYLGYLQLQPSSEQEEENSKPAGNAFMQGLSITLVNPKIIGFFIAFFPQFMDPHKSMISQLLVLGPVFLFTVFVLFIMFATFAAVIRPFMSSHSAKAILLKSSGLAYLVCAIYSITVEVL